MTQTIASTSATGVRPDEAAATWLKPFGEAIDARDIDAVLEHFAVDSWWRDLVAMSWDLTTLRGAEQMRPFLQENVARSGITNFALWDEAGPEYVDNGDGTGFVQAFLRFGTDVGWGLAVVRLVDVDGTWRAYSLMTALQELDGRELPVGPARPIGERVPGQTWGRSRDEALEFEQDPDVVILGAGHAGLSATAYLQLMGVDALALERNAAVGDVWRNRYDPLVLHDPIWLDQLPFMPFPETWPVYTPKDKLADWLEIYAKALDLNVWTSTELVSAEFSEAEGRWALEVRRGDGSMRHLRPRHFVMAVGLMNIPHTPDVDGRTEFAGEVLHTTEYTNGGRWKGKKAVVVGTGNSGHDVAKDLADQGASITMIQRSPTYVMTQKYSQGFLNGPAYTASGPGVHIADLMQIATPFGQMLEMAPQITSHMGDLDREVTDGLKASGFKVDDGSVSGGLIGLGLGVANGIAGGYLIDVGSAQYIIDGRIGIVAGEMRRFVPEGIELVDGTILEADLVVMATGFKPPSESVRQILGDEIAEACGPVWGVDQGNELNAMWRPCGHPNLWISAGSFPYSRIYNRFLALQIAADLDGIK